MQSRPLLIPAALAAAVTLLFTGCVDNTSGGEPTTEPSASTEVLEDEEAAALLPDDIVEAGVLLVGTDAAYPPNEFKDASGQPVGWEIELTDAIAATLGVGVEYQIASFDNIIPSITGDKTDMGMSSFTDNAERQQQVDFVDYYEAGIQWAQLAGGDVNPDDACGLKVAVQATTFEHTDELPGKSQACVDAGKPAIEILPFDSQDAAANAVVLGQADAMSADSPVTLYAIEQTDGKLEPAGDTFDSAPYGIPVAKGSDLIPALQAALEALIANGTYEEILTAWGVESGGVDTIEINAGS